MSKQSMLSFIKGVLTLRPIRKFLFTGWYSRYSVYWKLIGLFQNVHTRRKLSTLVAKSLPVSSTFSHHGAENQKQSYIEELESKGYCHLPSFDSELFSKVREFAYNSFVSPGQSSIEEQETYEFSAAQSKYPNENLFEIPIKHFSENPDILEIANQPEVLEVVERYLGCKPTLFNINLWWSIPHKDAPRGAQNFHRDWDDLKFVKYFIYLSDVDDECGPHVFVEGSHKSRKLNSTRRFSDEEVKQELPENRIIEFTGPAGTRFLEDTQGIHKGLLPSTTNRLILQFVYVLVPIGAYPLPQTKFEVEDNSKIDSYVSRLYI